MSEKIINFIFTYIIAWWLVLFCVLPFGINNDTDKNDDQNNNAIKGIDSGAPKTFKMKKTFIITSIATFIIVAIWSYLNNILEII